MPGRQRRMCSVLFHSIYFFTQPTFSLGPAFHQIDSTDSAFLSQATRYPLPQKIGPTFVLFTRFTILSDLFRLPQTNYPIPSAPANRAHICAFYSVHLFTWPTFSIGQKKTKGHDLNETSFGCSILNDMCSWDPFAIFIHPLESFILKLYNIWATNSMFYAHGLKKRFHN